MDSDKSFHVKISVITATRNCSATVLECLDSVAQQSYSNVEHVIIDGKSDDGTIELIKANQKGMSVLISEPDKGIYDALNKGIANSSGDVIGFLHADDVFAGLEVLENIAKVFEDPTICAVYGDLQYVSKDNIQRVVRNWQSSKFKRRDLWLGWMPPHPTLYVRREWYGYIGGFDSRYQIAGDYFSILQLFSNKNFIPTYLPMVFVKMRLGGASNRSIKNIILKSYEDLDALKRSGIGGLTTWICKNVRKIIQFC